MEISKYQIDVFLHGILHGIVHGNKNFLHGNFKIHGILHGNFNFYMENPKFMESYMEFNIRCFLKTSKKHS